MANITGTSGPDTLTGTINADTISGLAGNDTLLGLGGDDTLVGGPGNDSLDGGEGSDTYLIGTSDGFDVFTDSGTTGTDMILATADFAVIGMMSGFSPLSGIETISAGNHTGVAILAGAAQTMDFSATTLVGISEIFGSTGADTITGSAGNDTIDGRYGPDTLHGGPGDDSLIGGAGMDTLDGGPGNDTLVGGGGNDVLDGGEGSDTYQVGLHNGFDTFADTGTTGTDRIVATANNVAIGLKSGFGPASGIEEISADGHTGVSIKGGVGADALNFSATALTGITLIDGGLGNDTIIGSAGNDMISGGAGRDHLFGGLGDDTLIGGRLNDTLDGGDGSDTYLVGPSDGFDTYADSGSSGTDRILATANNTAIGLTSGFGPSSGIEEISANGHTGVLIIGGPSSDILDFSQTLLTGIVGINGSSGDDTITGSAGDDAIAGGAGADILIGGMGNDTLDGGGGIDTASYADATGGVTVNLSILAGQSVGGGRGIDTLVSIENLTGSNFDDSLTGDGGNNFLAGGAGNDTLIGGDGNDTLRGGPGDDLLDGGNGGRDFASFSDATSGVTVSLAIAGPQAVGGGLGNDTLVNIECLTGSPFNDTLIGDANDNVFRGGAGDDYIDGGGGNDTVDYLGAVSGVTVHLGVSDPQYVGGGMGFDTLISIENVIGSDFNDNLTGDANANVLVGGPGNDTLDGGAGIDTVSYAGAGDPNVGTGITVNLSITTAQLIGSGQGQDTILNIENVIGSPFNDTITGSAGANVLTGGLGADLLTGGGGNDVFVYRTIAEGGDTITDFVHGQDQIDLSAIDSGGGGPFNWAGTTPTAHSVWFTEVAGNTLVQADNSGDTTPDFQITLNGTALGLTASDFVL
jgi:Ca2+-binding RTX toxin-like protein